MASTLPDQTASQAVGDSTTFTLQVVSPSVGIPQPLALQGLPKDTTVKQLKERIRNAVNTKPTDQAQRLIHRGRLLARDDETMTEIFGQEAVCKRHLKHIIRKTNLLTSLCEIASLNGPSDVAPCATRSFRWPNVVYAESSSYRRPNTYRKSAIGGGSSTAASPQSISLPSTTARGTTVFRSRSGAHSRGARRWPIYEPSS